jgi:hypothetical protein
LASFFERQNPAKFESQNLKKIHKKWLNLAKKDAKFLNFDIKILPNLAPKVLPN